MRVADPDFPGLKGLKDYEMMEEWYSLKNFAPDLHVILTLDTKTLHAQCYERRPYPMTWARMQGKGRVFYTAIGDRPENWENSFFLSLLAGGLRWSLGDVAASANEVRARRSRAPNPR